MLNHQIGINMIKQLMKVPKIDAITSQFGLQQFFKEPTNILTDSSSCVDLSFTSQPNLVMESGVHSSRHHNICIN